MKRLKAVLTLLLLIACFAIQMPSHAAPWVSVYYTAYDGLQNPTPEQIDMRGITHLLFFALGPNADGSVNSQTYSLATNSPHVISVVHAAGKKCLICVGGGGTGPTFSQAIAPAVQSTFITNIVNFCVSEGFDGVDLDFEPMQSTDLSNFTSFVTNLRAALTAAKPGLLLTSAAEPYGFPATFAAVQDKFDQINVMTYDLSGPWPGWSTWYNSALYNSGLSFANGRPYPSCDNVVGTYEAAGIPKSKLAIGAAFYGDDWQGANGPNQSLGNGSVSMGALTYYAIMTQFYTASAYHWDDTADAPYLSIGSQFISYDDPRLVALKVDYVKSQGLGGLMAWNIGQQFMGNNVTGDAQQPLLAAIYNELAATQPPTAPTNLTATPGNAQVTLNWTGSPAATSYNIYRGTTAGGESSTAVATGITGTTYTNTSLANGATYYYTVKGVDTVGTSTASNEASATPFVPVPPAAPTGLAATSGNAQASLTWNASTGATSYNVYRGTTAGGESTTPVATALTSTSYVNTGLNNGTAYYFKVAAVSSAGTSALSNEATTTPTGPVESAYPSGTPWPVPGTVHAENYDLGGEGLAYHDIDAANQGGQYRPADGVDIEACTDTGGGYNVAYSAVGEFLKYTVNVAAAGSYTVSFRVASATSGGTFHLEDKNGVNLTGALTAPGTGGWQTWTTVNATITLTAGTQILKFVEDTMNNGYNINYLTFAQNSTSPPAAPTGLAASASNSQVTLTWTASSGATSYNVYCGTTAGGESTTAIATGVTSTTYTNTGLTNGTAYFYKVAAANSAGTSGLSNEASATPQPTAPSAPSNLAATPSNAQIALTWTAGAGAISYNVYRGTTAGGESTTAIATGVTSTSFTNTGLTNGTAYFYKVKSVNSAGTSAYSNEASSTPSNPPPATPTGLAASAGNTQVSLTWNTSTGATSYNVYRGTTAGGESTTAIATSVGGTSYTNTGLTNGTGYYYKVAAVGSGGTSGPSNEASATPSAGGGSTSGPVSINCGGAASGTFVADTDFTGGSATSTAAAIDTGWLVAPAPAQAVLQTQRVGACTYTLGGFTPNSAHQITMFFVEPTFTAVGQRQFNIVINGATQTTNFDIFGTVGAKNKAYQVNYGGIADSTGKITIQFIAGAHDQPIVAAISVPS